ncbi:phospholipase C, phosphocholine-specific [Microlunatus panaciterrae]
MARPMRPGGLRAIKHVIVLMQENRAFDHYFGTLRGVRGFNDGTPLRLPDGQSVFHQPDAAGGTVLPFSVRQAAADAGRDRDAIQYLGALAHGFKDATQAWADGWYDRWIPAKTPACMTYYERRDIALQYELADTFSFCDAYHCSVFGSTNPNRNYLWSGTVGNEPGSPDRAVTNAAYSYDHAGYDWTTYPERLESAGISWQIYQEWDNFTDNAVEYFQRFKKIGHQILAHVHGGYRTTEEFYDKLFAKTDAERSRALGEFEAGVAALAPEDRRLFTRAMYRSEPGTLRARLKADIKGGTLPAVTWLVPPAIESEHPSVSTPVGSANLIYDVLDMIASDPDTWSSTVLMLNFDENDGYFDHVPPPVAPRPESGNSDDWFNGQPIGLGPRVPMTVVSPWTVGGRVSSEVFDHTSVLQFLERWTGVAEPNISQWRRAATGDLTGLFSFERQRQAPSLRAPGPVPAVTSRWSPTPPKDQALPAQESGRRHTCPLPYRPSVHANVRAGEVALELTNTGSAPAHFAIYRYGGERRPVEHLDVRRAALRRIPLGTDRYHLAIQGPNRFWRELSGSTSGQAAAVEATARQLPGRQVLDIILTNGGREQVTVTLTHGDEGTPRSQLRLRAHSTRRVSWSTDQGWYDVSVAVVQDPTFHRRLTGRVEDGRMGVSPPDAD